MTSRCQLRISRNLAPPNRWHWAVDLPSGHLFAAKGGFTDAGACAESAAVAGVAALMRAEASLVEADPLRPAEAP